MNMKKLLTASAIAVSVFGSGVSYAGIINVSGIEWDTDSPLDFSSTTATISQTIDATNGVASGFGVITTINGTGIGEFLKNATELTFAYGGFAPIGGANIPSPSDPTGTQIFYSGGFARIYADQDNLNVANPNNPLLLTAANTTDGTLWLDLAGHEINGSSLTGTNNFQAALGQLLGAGQLDVIGGSAQVNFDTNTKAGNSDFTFTNSFTSFPTGSVLFSTGAGTFQSDSVTVTIPEPASLALIALGLFGLGAIRKFK